MTDGAQVLQEEYTAALQEYLAEPHEAGLMRTYDTGRRALGLGVGVAGLAIIHGQALAAALADVSSAQERARLTQRASEFLSETMAPFELMLTGYKEANTLLQDLNETLEQRVADRTSALKESEELLKEASRRKDEFLAMLAHELRNPLAPIRNAVQIMRLTRNDPEEVDRALDMMERQIQNFVRLIDDLMDVSRITRGKIELRKERLDLALVVQRAIEISRPHVEAGRHELTVALTPSPVYVHGDLARLAQVLANLLNNATKYTEEQGRIWVTAEREGDQAVVRVRDTGIGIPTEMLPDIFELFVQVPSALDRAQGGVGVGLTLVKRLVEMHGGTIEAHSAGPCQGSEFVVRLPVVGEERKSMPPTPNESKDATTSQPAGLRVLVVDDHQDAAKSLGRLLKLAGHHVCIAHDGPSALELVRTFRPRVLLQDIAMPGMSGYEVAQAIRAQPGMKDVFLVALTGYGSEEDRRRSQKAGFDHHLVKPVDFRALQQLLGSLGL